MSARTSSDLFGSSFSPPSFFTYSPCVEWLSWRIEDGVYRESNLVGPSEGSSSGRGVGPGLTLETSSESVASRPTREPVVQKGSGLTFGSCLHRLPCLPLMGTGPGTESPWSSCLRLFDPRPSTSSHPSFVIPVPVLYSPPYFFPRTFRLTLETMSELLSTSHPEV